MNPLPPISDDRLEKMRSGRRLLVWALLVNAYLWLTFMFPWMRLGDPHSMFGIIVDAAVYILAVGLSAVGLLRIGRGMGGSWFECLFACVISIFPIANVILLLVFISKATKVLKAGTGKAEVPSDSRRVGEAG